MFNQFTTHWVTAWKRAPFRIEWLISLIGLLTVLSIFSQFVNWVETRQGVVLSDPVLALIKPADLTWLTFAIIYLSLIGSIAAMSFSPERLTMAIQTYTVMVLLRMGAMYLIPLDAPPAMIALNDPLVEILGTGKLLTRDLFFSGHTATIFVLFLCVQQKFLKIILLAGTFVLAACLLTQHVHYSVDVFAAPFFAYGANRLVFLFHRKVKPNSIVS